MGGRPHLFYYYVMPFLFPGPHFRPQLLSRSDRLISIAFSHLTKKTI